jgi:hypothetical protein
MALDTDVIHGEPPFYGGSGGIASVLSDGQFAAQLLDVADPAVQTLPTEDREFDHRPARLTTHYGVSICETHESLGTRRLHLHASWRETLLSGRAENACSA